MPTPVDRDELQRLVGDREAFVAEVLPQPEYEWAHLPGAIHLPLKGWEPEEVEAVLDRSRPVVVYCNDFV